MSIRKIRTKDRISDIAEPFGIKSFECDGNDVLQVYKVANIAVEYSRSGKGPVFIEFRTYRLRGHVGPDDNIQGTHTEIRPAREVEQWKKKDPIQQLADYIITKKIFSDKKLNQINSEISEEVNNAHIFAQKSKRPSPKEVLKYVFK